MLLQLGFAERELLNRVWLPERTLCAPPGKGGYRKMDDTQRTGWQKRILLFLTNGCITLFGFTLVQMALVWYATMQTSSGVWVAAFTVCSYLPQFLISFIGGVWADRYHRKKLIIGADMLIAFATFVMVLAIPHISSEPALLGGLLVMSVIRSLGAGIQTPAVNAVIPQLIPEDQLMRYNGINVTMQSIVNFAAPAVAGAVFAISTLRTTIMIDIVTAILGTADCPAWRFRNRILPLKKQVSFLT